MGIAGEGGPIATAHGADEVIDYRSKSLPELSALIASAANGGIHHAFDAVSENGTLSAISEALGKNGGGKATYVLTATPEELASLPKGVEFVRTLVATAYGEDAAFATKWFDAVGKWIEEGSFKAQKVTVIPMGLDGVGEGLRRLEAHEVHSEKFVYRIAETPGLA